MRKRCGQYTNIYDQSLLASGDDDCSLKLWHLTLNQNAQSQPTQVIICSVRFQPNNRYHLPYASTGKGIHMLCNCLSENSLVTIIIAALSAMNKVMYHFCRFYNYIN